MIVYPKTYFANAKAKQSKSSTISSIFWLYLMLRVILIGQAGKLASGPNFINYLNLGS